LDIGDYCMAVGIIQARYPDSDSTGKMVFSRIRDIRTGTSGNLSVAAFY